MTYRDHYTTCKLYQNAREMQSEACQVLLLFVIIHLLLQSFIGFHACFNMVNIFKDSHTQCLCRSDSIPVENFSLP